MGKRELICIGCPLGCNLEIEMEGNQVVKVTGNTCKRGEEYGIKECTHPTRMVTSSVVVEGGLEEVVPVKTEKDIPKGMIFDVMKELKQVVVQAPVQAGDVIVKDILHSGVNIIATKKVDCTKD